MTRNKFIFFQNKHSKNYSSGYFLKKAWKNFSEKQIKDELRYIEGILDLNKLGVIFSNKTDKDWGKRIKDFVYGYWTEEDIRLKLASELNQFNDCQVHGQIHIYGRKNTKSYGYKPKGFHIHKYPDLIFIVFKEKERNPMSIEKNIEATAIEVKYFYAGRNEKELKKSISDDLDKLIDYQNKRVMPKVDCGYFFCIDETNKVGGILTDLFLKKKYKKYSLGYAILVPRYTKLNLSYPREYESLERGEVRKINYLFDYIRSQLNEVWYVGEKLPNEDKDRGETIGYYMSFKFKEVRNAWGWLEITWPKYIERLNKNYFGVIMKVNKYYSFAVKNYSPYKWPFDKSKWIKTEKNTGEVLIYKINKNKLYNLKRIEEEGNKIVKF